MSLPRLSRPITAALVVLGVVIATAAPVAAATAYAPRSTKDQHAAAAASAPVSPSGCVQTADNPHASTHVRGTMGGAIRARCRNPVPELTHSAQLWETRWWGWDRIGNKGTVTQFWRNAANAFGTDNCKSSTVRITGSGSVIDVDGRRYYASTESKHIKNPCHL